MGCLENEGNIVAGPQTGAPCGPHPRLERSPRQRPQVCGCGRGMETRTATRNRPRRREVEGPPRLGEVPRGPGPAPVAVAVVVSRVASATDTPGNWSRGWGDMVGLDRLVRPVGRSMVSVRGVSVCAGRRERERGRACASEHLSSGERERASLSTLAFPLPPLQPPGRRHPWSQGRPRVMCGGWTAPRTPSTPDCLIVKTLPEQRIRTFFWLLGRRESRE